MSKCDSIVEETEDKSGDCRNRDVELNYDRAEDKLDVRPNVQFASGSVDLHADSQPSNFGEDKDENCVGEKVLFNYALIYKTVLRKAKWGHRPTENSDCKIIITFVTSEGVAEQEIKESPTTSLYFHASFGGGLTIGDADTVIDRAVERSVQSLLVGERSDFTLKFSSITAPEVVENDNECSIMIQCQIELLHLESDSPIYDWNDEKIYERALYHKTKGVELFKDCRYVEAFQRFSKSFTILNSVDVRSRNDDIATSLKSLRVILYTNMASCQLEFQNDQHAVTLCSKALAFDANNIKALYRRALAYGNMSKFEDAKNDLKNLLQIEPNNSAATLKLAELKEITKEKDATYATIMRKMFSN